jgi:uncharacterized protein (DUF2141 family)
MQLRTIARFLVTRLVLASTICSVAGLAQQAEIGPLKGGCTLHIHVTGLRNQKGHIAGALFKSSEGWPEDRNHVFREDAYPFSGNTATLTFLHVPPGKYGVAVIHDENSNDKLDRNLFGIPIEGFGFANNPRVVWRAPAFKDSLVSVTCPVTETTIRIIYM